MTSKILTSTVLLFVVLNFFGNLPVFITSLSTLNSYRYRKVVIRECGFAFLFLIFFMVGGNGVLKLLNISQASIELAGGIILFMIAIQLVFGSVQSDTTDDMAGTAKRKEPFIVPLAIPLLAGPGTISTVIMLGADGKTPLWINLLALILAMAAGMAVLLAGRRLGRILGPKFLSAMETLMGLLLSAMATEMLIRGIKNAFLS